MKKITLLFAALFCMLTVSAKTLYLKPSSNWQEANAKFYAWVWADNQAGSWVHFADKVQGTSEVIYYVDVADNINNLIIVRVNPSEQPNLDNNWARTGDLTNIGANNCFANNGWDTNFAWSTYTPVIKTYTFTINFYTTWAEPKVYIFDSGQANSWPGVAITSLAETRGANWWTVTFTDIEETASFILNGSGGQTADLTVKDNHTSGDYYMNGGGKLVSCVAPISVTLAPTTTDVEIGKTVSLTPTIAPDNATDKAIKWTSDQPTIATVEGGVVKGVAEGTATITATTYNGKTATCTVTVKPAATIAVTSITIDPAQLTLTAGDVAQTPLTVTVLPNDAADKTYTWASDKPEVATVADGIVTAVAKGTANITATAKDGSGIVGTCVVTVNPKLYTFTVKFHNNQNWEKVYIYAWGDGIESGVGMNAWPGKELTANEKGWYVQEFTDAAPSFLFTAGDQQPQTVNITGYTADACFELGDQILEDGHADRGKYTVKNDIDCDQDFTTPATKEYYLVGYWNGADYTGTDYKFVDGSVTIDLESTSYIYVRDNSSNDYKVETFVDQTNVTSGEVVLETGKNYDEKMGVPAGKLTFTLTENADGSLKVSFTKAPQAVESITLSDETVKIQPNQSYILSAEIAPIGATNKALTWESNNEAVATVDQKGRVTTLAVGEAKITATAQDGSEVKAECTVTVSTDADDLAGITLNFKKHENWEKVSLWAWTKVNGANFNFFESWPGKEITNADAEGVYSYTFDANYSSISFILNDGKESDALQTTDRTITENTCVIVTKTGEGEGDEEKVTYVSTIVDCDTWAPAVIRVESLAWYEGSEPRAEIAVGDKEYVNIAINPNTATNQTLRFESSVAGIVSGAIAPHPTGGYPVLTIEALAEGKTTITITSEDNKDAKLSYSLTVVKPIETALENAEVEAKAIKVIENGQLIIIRDGVRYNVLGGIIK